jgi:geranylgeranyl pyrophosphate synthase
VAVAAKLDRVVPPTLSDLLGLSRPWLESLGLPQAYAGFAMVTVSNAFWLDAFSRVPPARRLLLLPHCLAQQDACRATVDAYGLHCADCGQCEITRLRAQGEAMGYQVIVAEGTGQLLERLTAGAADAILGVACMDSLARFFTRLSEFGVPHLAVPLLRDGCRNTETDLDYLRSLLARHEDGIAGATRSFLPLLRQTRLTFESPLFDALVSDALPPASGQSQWLQETDRLALDYLRRGGKRLRPFTVLAACAVGRRGEDALLSSADLCGLIGPAEQRVAIAVETLHKASLVHDDIEDDDEYRYGRPTLHRAYGIPAAVNLGDHMVGMGYNLIASQRGALGGNAVADMLAVLSRSHMELARGQGAELFWQTRPDESFTPADALRLYALKTSPAFEAALYCGLRLAEAPFDSQRLRSFCTCLGAAFQVANDLGDWKADESNKRLRGRDALAGRPTLLRAMAAQSAGQQAMQELDGARAALSAERWVDRCQRFYDEQHVFERAADLQRRMRESAMASAGQVGSDALAYLLRAIVRLGVPEVFASSRA